MLSIKVKVIVQWERTNGYLRSPTESGLPLSFLLGCTSGANETARIFLLSQVFCPVRIICVNYLEAKRETEELNFRNITALESQFCFNEIIVNDCYIITCI